MKARVPTAGRVKGRIPAETLATGATGATAVRVRVRAATTARAIPAVAAARARARWIPDAPRR